MEKLILACVEYLAITRPYRVSFQSSIKNKNWAGYHTAWVTPNGKVLRHEIKITMQDIQNADILAIIAHEFVHAWQAEYRVKGNTHGKRFQNKCLALENHLKSLGFKMGALYRPGIDY